ncbi:MAG: NUDIX hydrolase [Acidobacteria bacterium]|nr:MAG: NUDIX hydrolase [Acidobacteriota bacterium]REK01883.1 MAG: NUDIX hydrolase [Acidobacteriota bacterium]REK14839.1 MAG: NUDIX hydrolase [Acidobacteriota bacterium]REK45554.1 MAG: NUDIX hydrolase [Acidobacteriota bacterium]
MPPEILSTSTLLVCDLFDVTRSRIRENGVEYYREIIVHPGSAVIVPYFEDGTIALVSQYRHPAGKPLLELPAGSIDPGESAEECASREVREEVGVKAGSLEFLTEFYVSPGFLSEKMTVFLATELTHDPADGDDDEFIDVVRMPLAEAAQLARSGRLCDAKTMLGVLLAETRATR